MAMSCFRACNLFFLSEPPQQVNRSQPEVVSPSFHSFRLAYIISFTYFPLIMVYTGNYSSILPGQPGLNKASSQLGALRRRNAINSLEQPSLKHGPNNLRSTCGAHLVASLLYMDPLHILRSTWASAVYRGNDLSKCRIPCSPC